ncbi:MAG TPA: PqiC family protein [Usitatibacter sp.]|nr:PqiC family protein [Usitatibacter sp.]
MRTASLVAAAALLAACGSPLKERYYLLEGPGGAGPASAANAMSVHVGPVVVPESVDRPSMVIRTAPNQVDISDAHRWAEPLKAAVPRVIAENLMRELGTPRVTATRIGANQPVDYRVALEVQRFDSSPSDGATVEAIWTVTPKQGAARTGRSAITEPAASPDPAGLAAAHSRALGRLAREIAAEIRR